LAICSIDGDEEPIIDHNDITTTQRALDHYLESPIVNNRTYTYHARVYVSCIKPLFIIMKNDMFMKWLQKHRIFLEENDLETMLPATVGLVFFIHPRPPLFEVYLEQFKAMFVGKTCPKFKIRRLKVKSRGESALAVLIQTMQDKAQEVSRQFEAINHKNPYEFLSWKTWTGLHESNKEATIKTHNEYLNNVQVLNIPGFCDEEAVLMGKTENDSTKNDYSKVTLNEFITTHYSLGGSIPMFTAIMGPFLGKRLFILPAKLASAGTRLLEMLHADILRCRGRSGNITKLSGNSKEGK
jgi:hypothetical protein